RIFMKNDVVAVEWVCNAKHTGNFQGIPATNKNTGLQGLWIGWYNNDGLVKEAHNYFDVGTLMSQLGVSKQKARGIPTVPAEPQVLVSKGTPEEEKNLDVVKAGNAALDAKKEGDWLATMTETPEWDDMTTPDTIKGRDGAKKWLKAMTTAFPDMKFTTDN